jgi:hypothetical protein
VGEFVLILPFRKTLRFRVEGLNGARLSFPNRTSSAGKYQSYRHDFAVNLALSPQPAESEAEAPQPSHS